MTDDDHFPRGLRAAVQNHRLDAENPLHYLVLLATEARRHDGHWDGDPERAARWVVAQWCQELGYVPDLRASDPGETVDKDDLPEHATLAVDAHQGGARPDPEGRQ